MTTKGKNNNFDASEFVSPWIKKEELKAGPKTFTVEDVSETTFEARGRSSGTTRPRART